MTDPYLSEVTAAGGASDVAVEWDRGNDQWWDWYMSLADDSGPTGPLTDPAPHDPGPLPSDDALVAELEQPYPITDAQVAAYRAESSVKLPGVLSPACWSACAPGCANSWTPTSTLRSGSRA